MTDTRLHALSPLDGRYGASLTPLAGLFSEAGLIRQRIKVEALWLLHLAEAGLPELKALPAAARDTLAGLARELPAGAAERVKEIERRTNHDVKAVEYYLRERLTADGTPAPLLEFIHFGCTSEDINNLAYALMLVEARQALLPTMSSLAGKLDELATQHAGLPMLSRTHGQSATPTTLGKELRNVWARLARAQVAFVRVRVLGKINGAVGNYNAHAVAYPDVDWPAVARGFVESLGIDFNPLTIQIEPHDWIAEYCDALARYDNVLIDFCRDVWGYVSLGYFRQRAVAGEVGSSTMPHKVNPIDFENAEGNLGVANALLRHFSDKLPRSRWQRDLTDSTVLRNVGVAVGHAALALHAVGRGLGKLDVDPTRLAADLDTNWEVLAEPIQMVMRRYGVADAYDQLKAFTRGRRVGAAEFAEFVAGLDLPPAVKRELATLTPATYLGYAAALARRG